MSEELETTEEFETEQEQEQEVDPQVVVAEENRARMTGWTPKEEFKGDKRKWVDASTWNDRTDNIMPIMKATNKRLEEDLGATKAELQSLKKTLERLGNVYDKVSEREYKRALETIRKEQAAAISEGDAEKWENLERQKDTLEKPEKVQIEPAATPNDGMNKFVKNNEWYGKDANMTGYAHYIANQLAIQGVPVNDQYAEIENKVREQFPEYFSNARQNESTTANSTTITPAPSSKNKKYASLPQEAKDICDMLCKTVNGYTKEKYLEDYYGGTK